MNANSPAHASLEAVFREEHGRLLAALARRFGDLDLADEVAAEAVEAALVRWPVDGVPPNPGGWLMTTARRRAVDRLRRDSSLAARLGRLWAETEERSAVVAEEGSRDALPDERLQLFFTCSHPALPAADRIALTLRYLGGLTTVEVARALLVPEETMAKRLVRAKKKIHGARIPFTAPAVDQLPERLPGVLQVLSAIFTEGYATTSGPDLQRIDLCDEAIRLTRILHRILPAQREVTGLLGLLLLTHARTTARTDDAGLPVLLADQDRTRWDADLIVEGIALAEASLTGGPPGPYGVQAAIAAIHAEAADEPCTDWRQIVMLYDVLAQLAPSPVTAMNRAAAVAMSDGPVAGLTLLDQLADEPTLRGHGPFHACRGDLLERLQQWEAAASAYQKALACNGSAPEHARLEQRLRVVQSRVHSE